MTQKDKTQSSADKKTVQAGEKDHEAQKTCFVIMPIADMDGYEAGHFTRVYEHLIKPACSKAGYVAHRADLVAASNYIIIDILRKIVESDLVICDLSGRNPNVLYELGVRQAFNLPTVLIKDQITPRIFDIQGLRCADYRHSLRIDEVHKEQENIRNAIIETTEKPNDFNSMIQLLGVSPAALPARVELSNETSVILQSLKNISSRLTEMEARPIRSTPKRGLTHYINSLSNANGFEPDENAFLINGEPMSAGDTVWLEGQDFGTLVDFDSSGVTVRASDGALKKITPSHPKFSKISSLPF
ncbi:hypothetical protein [Pseudomonas lurida]|uniref:hypothetical protein n=1 Tax=Pseudomonas lurida TaxID=244566 RepID=UPI001F1BCFD8|nr:hypothetical protein [Pseudomonas lurida]MCF5024710.1 hypothetical protein [Pseudomonas lurida]MCF5307449.1 hypothetical protein [Pseudomonas lurida]MCF5324526.1 hypothetical protein [Pseudomonas lurida]